MGSGPGPACPSPSGPAGGLPRCPAVLFTRDDEKGAFSQSQESQSSIDLNLWGVGGETERGEHLHVSKRRHEGHGVGEEREEEPQNDDHGGRSAGNTSRAGAGPDVRRTHAQHTGPPAERVAQTQRVKQVLETLGRACQVGGHLCACLGRTLLDPMPVRLVLLERPTSWVRCEGRLFR